MRCLFGNVIPTCSVGVVPPSSKGLAKDWVEGFLDSPERVSVDVRSPYWDCNSYGGLMCQPER